LQGRQGEVIGQEIFQPGAAVGWIWMDYPEEKAPLSSDFSVALPHT
jgi:hypothetical protein